MYGRFKRLFAAFAILFGVLLSAGQTSAQDDLGSLMDALADANLREMRDIVGQIAATGNPQAVSALQALQNGDLVISDGSVFIGRRSGGSLRLIDPATGEETGETSPGAVDQIRISNAIRVAVRDALGAMTLMSDNPVERMRAAQQAFGAADPEQIEALEGALEAEDDPAIAALLQQARASAILNSDAGEELKLEAVATIAARGDRDALNALSSINDPSEAVAAAAGEARERIQTQLELWGIGQNVFYGLSLGSVLLLAALGLAITFGVMGVINMAHGEMVMLGAYATYVVQQIIRTHAPGLFDASLFFAIPAAFLFAGAVGVLIERGVIRWLYGRPLETLLATWGVSLILQQAIRTVFGATNREVGIPSWMSGTVQVGLLDITLNRLTIIIFSLIVLAALMAAMRYTSFGLNMRAVTQNRRMASAMGIRTSWVDALTFGLGSGIAGVAGVALSQIDNVSPNLGQNYIIDSFMVVVFGGVGNLWGTLVAAMSLGVANKFLEPYAGAVLAKIIILVLIILFIQRRPRGLFALKGRAAEA